MLRPLCTIEWKTRVEASVRSPMSYTESCTKVDLELSITVDDGRGNWMGGRCRELNRALQSNSLGITPLSH